MTDDVVIVGGGPAGMMLGYLLARAGVGVTVLEKHRDFLRDFRGDTVHPATLELFAELGLAEALLRRPHDRVERLHADFGERRLGVADFRRLPVRHPFVAMMPQWEFLDFLGGEAARFPAFRLRMGTEALGVVMRGDRVTGVQLAGGVTLPARLVVAADGRRSVLREAAALPLRDLGAPIDVLWFRLPKAAGKGNDTAVHVGRGALAVLIDRGSYWQCAWLIRKGGADALRRRGLPAFRERIAAELPALDPAALMSWDEVKLLAVSLDRLERWSRPGLLAIGDAAHAMSPVGGVGVNLAIQDAVAAANILGLALARGEPVDHLLPKVQARRMLPTRGVQRVQRLIHDRLLAPVLTGRETGVPLLARLLDAVPPLQAIPARLVGFGLRREHIRSPAAYTRSN